MRQTLFYIPETLLGQPVFGFGIALVLLTVAVAAAAAVHFVRSKHWDSELVHYAGLWLTASLIVLFVAPNMLEPGKGFPIRGYGFFLLLAVVSSLGLILKITKHPNITTDQVFSLCLWVMVSGILGARVFYVAEYWNEMVQRDAGGNIIAAATLFNLLNIANGGLVVFGSLIGGMLGSLFYLFRQKLPILASFDMMAPAMFLGLAVGRLGCLMNGCCFGGVCTLPWAITFPINSPAHIHQVIHGATPPDIVLPVHPTQIYSSLTAAVLCLVLLFLRRLKPYRERDGLLLGTFLLLYSAARFVIEMIRIDEDSFLGTGLTVSQNVSIGVFAFGAVLTLWVLNRKKDAVNRSE